MVASLEFFQILVIDQSLTPKVLEKGEVGPACLERLAAFRMFESNMIHPHVPGRPPTVAAVLEIAQRALYRSRRLFEKEVAQAVLLPLLHVVRNIRTTQKPKGTLIQRGSALIQRPLEDSVILFQERHAGELAGQACADGSLGRRGVGEVVERRRVGRSVGSVMDAGGRHGRAVAASRACVRARRASSG